MKGVARNRINMWVLGILLIWTSSSGSYRLAIPLHILIIHVLPPTPIPLPLSAQFEPPNNCKPFTRILQTFRNVGRRSIKICGDVGEVDWAGDLWGIVIGYAACPPGWGDGWGWRKSLCDCEEGEKELHVNDVPVWKSQQLDFFYIGLQGMIPWWGGQEANRVGTWPSTLDVQNSFFAHPIMSSVSFDGLEGRHCTQWQLTVNARPFLICLLIILQFVTTSMSSLTASIWSNFSNNTQLSQQRRVGKMKGARNCRTWSIVTWHPQERIDFRHS